MASNLVFRQLGGSWQLEIPSAEVLEQIHQLDTARWAATSVPTRDLQCDAGFLAYMDPAGKGRLLVDQLLAGRDWLFKHLKGRGRLASKTEELQLSDVDTSHADGQGIVRLAERILRESGAASAKSITLTQIRTFRASYAQGLANGDAIVCPETVTDTAAAGFMKDVIAVLGGEKEMSGRQGVSASAVDAFFAGSKAYLDWKATGEADGVPNPAVAPWGKDTAAAADLVQALDAKVTQFFWQCDLVRAEPDAAARLHLSADELKALAVQDPAAIEKALAAAPLSAPNPEAVLALDKPANPYWEARLRVLATVVERALGAGAKTLTRENWGAVKAVFAPWWAWRAAKPAPPFEKLSDDVLRGYLAGGPAVDAARGFIAKDAEAAPEFSHLVNLEKLVLYQRWMLELANNFVNFSALWDSNVLSLFEMGALIIDGRRLEFTVRVPNRDAHKKVATEGKIFLVYAVITEKEGGATVQEVAAPVTRGERGRLIVGKRGIFESRDGKIYDAQIVDVLEHPISIIEAVKAPFRRTAAFISKKIEEFAASRAASAEAAAQTNLAKVGEAATAPATPAAAPPPAASKKGMEPGVMAGVLAGGGLALAALGSALAYIVSALSKISIFDLVLALGSVVGLIVAFSALLGWLKLRLRDLGPVLEANGWAVNPRVKVSGPLAGLFNRIPALPAGHRKNLVPPKSSAGPEEEDAGKGKTIVAVALFIVLVILILALNAWRSSDPAPSAPAPAPAAAAPAPATP